MENAIQLSERLVGGFSVGRVFKDATKPVNSLDFTVDGMMLFLVSIHHQGNS